MNGKQHITGWKRISAVLGAVILISAAGAAIGLDIRFWAWASDLMEVAGASYTSLLSIKLDRLGAAEDRLDRCKADRNRDCVRQRNEVNRLLQEIEDIKRDKKKHGG